jgi:tripartite-type tricarboxylate transporter receptor subunit TctC
MPPHPHRRTLLAAALGAAAPHLTTHRAAAQGGGGAWPTRPVRVIVPFAPGGPADVIARSLAERLGEAWGQPVVVENRAGAGGNIGGEHVARSAPDGYTLLLAASSHVQNTALYRNLPYDPIRDFTPVTQVAYYGLVVVVHPSMPVTTLAEFMAFLRERDGQVTITSAGTGTPTHLSAELFALRTGTRFTHVPFQGAAPAHTALLVGQVQAMFHNPVLAVPAVRAERLRALATTGAARSAALPQVPTVAESGHLGYEAGTWFAVLGPAGIPEAVVARIDADLRRVLSQPALRERFATLSLEIPGAGPEELGRIMRDDQQRWAELIRRLGIRAD